MNLGEEAADVHHVAGEIALSTNREREGESVVGTLKVHPREGVIVDGA